VPARQNSERPRSHHKTQKHVAPQPQAQSEEFKCAQQTQHGCTIQDRSRSGHRSELQLAGLNCGKLCLRRFLNSKFSTAARAPLLLSTLIVGEWEGMVGDKGLEPLTSPV